MYCIIGKNSEYIVHIHTISFLNSVCKLYKKQNCWTSLTKKVGKARQLLVSSNYYITAYIYVLDTGKLHEYIFVVVEVHRGLKLKNGSKSQIFQNKM